MNINGSEKPRDFPATVGDVLISPATTTRGYPLKNKGPFKTKAGGRLDVAFALSHAEAKDFLSYDHEEVSKVPGDIRGMRLYVNHQIPLAKGTVGGTEFHRIRQEIVVCIAGQIWWECEDVRGHKLHVDLKPGSCIIQPPFILHTYEVRDNQSGMVILANTLFNPEEPATHDTFSLEDFRELQESYTTAF